MSLIPLPELADSAPESRPLLEDSIKAFGMLPGLHKALSHSPQALEGYKTLHTLFGATAFTNAEKHVVWQSINHAHSCHYCQPAHSAIAKMMGVDPALDAALRTGAPLTDPKLEALRVFTLAVLEARGAIPDAAVESLFAAGYGPRAVIDVLLGMAQKVLSNYTNHIARPPVDAAFAAYIETPAAA